MYSEFFLRGSVRAQKPYALSLGVAFVFCHWQAFFAPASAGLYFCDQMAAEFINAKVRIVRKMMESCTAQPAKDHYEDGLEEDEVKRVQVAGNDESEENSVDREHKVKCDVTEKSATGCLQNPSTALVNQAAFIKKGLAEQYF